MPKISVTCVTYNSSQFIKACLDSLGSQTFKDFEVIITDNASSDGTANMISEIYPGYRLIRNRENAGYCAAQNQAISAADGEYIFTLNPDIILDRDFLSHMCSCAEEHPDVGSIAPKLLMLKDGVKTNTIDSLGHSIGKNRYVKNLASGKHDSNKFEKEEYIFGVSGAAAFYRKKMLESIKYENEYLDEDFFLGYDDVDIDWRAKLKGWRTLYQPKAVAWHIRSASLKKTGRMWAFYNYRNRYLTILKNDNIGRMIRDIFSILLYETGMLLTMILQGQLIPVAVSVFKVAPKILKKRIKNGETAYAYSFFK